MFLIFKIAIETETSLTQCDFFGQKIILLETWQDEGSARSQDGQQFIVVLAVTRI